MNRFPKTLPGCVHYIGCIWCVWMQPLRLVGLFFPDECVVWIRKPRSYTLRPEATAASRLHGCVWKTRLRLEGLFFPDAPEKSPETSPGEFHVGDWVWLRETKYDGAELCPVFAPRWTGLFQIWEVWDKSTYRLRSDPRYSGKKTISILRNPVNVNRLHRYVEREWKLETRAEAH
jgi:hypothetical protein